MTDKIKELFVKYKEIITYIIFGGLTTVVSFCVFLVLEYAFELGKTTLIANIIANIAGVLFAYFTNRKWVFESKAKGKEAMSEFTKFIGGRAFTVALDLAFVWLAVDILLGTAWVWKLVSNVVVIVLNYIISKLLVFVKKNK